MSVSSTSTNDYPASFRACRLFQKKSKAGTVYFSGRWGGAKVALVKTKEVADDGQPVWAFLLSEAPAQKQDEQPATQTRASAPAAPYKPRTHSMMMRFHFEVPSWHQRDITKHGSRSATSGSR